MVVGLAVLGPQLCWEASSPSAPPAAGGSVNGSTQGPYVLCLSQVQAVQALLSPMNSRSGTQRWPLQFFNTQLAFDALYDWHMENSWWECVGNNQTHCGTCPGPSSARRWNTNGLFQTPGGYTTDHTASSFSAFCLSVWEQSHSRTVATCYRKRKGLIATFH